MKLRKFIAALCGILLSLAAAVTGLTLILDGLGGSAPLMLQLMEQHAPPESTGLPQEHYPAMAEMITDYLSGREKAFQFSFTDAQGVSYQCFHAKEQQHMADVNALFDLDRLVLLFASAAVAVLTGCACWLRAQRATIARGFGIGLVLVLLALTAVAVWAALDFESVFVLFHRLFFTNELWLLDPRTDLLIRLMPTAFFIHYAAILGGTWLGLLVILLAVARYLSTRWQS